MTTSPTTALVVLSGGQDSTTCLAKAIHDLGKENVHAVTFYYGQRHAREVLLAQLLAEKYLLPGRWRLIDLSFLGAITKVSALTVPQEVEVTGKNLTEVHQNIDQLHIVKGDIPQEDIERLRAAVQQAESDPAGGIRVTHLDDEMQAMDKRMAGLGVDATMLEGSTEYASASDSLTHSAGTKASQFDAALPDSFVPGRNLIFLSVAASYAANLGCTEVWTGVCQTDYSGYPDCREGFVASMEVSVNAAMMSGAKVLPYRAWDPAEGVEQEFNNGIEVDYKGEPRIRFVTPLMFLTKAESVEMMRGLGEDAWGMLGYTHTDYNGNWPPRMDNPASEIRAKGFEDAGFEDPLVTRSADPVDEYSNNMLVRMALMLYNGRHPDMKHPLLRAASSLITNRK